MFGSDTRVMQVGPARSGKTATMGGLQLALEDIHGTDVRESAEMSEIRRHLLEGKFPPPTRGLHWLETSYTAGRFSRTASLQTVDYGGELLRDALAPVRDTDISLSERASDWQAAKERVERLATDGGEDEMVTTDRVASAIWDCLRHADGVLLTVPLGDFLGPVVARGTEREYADIVRADDYETEAELKDALGLEAGEPMPAASGREYAGQTFYTSGANRPVRTKPEEYLHWYRRLRTDSRLADTDFLYVVTKADHALVDFSDDGPRESPPNYEAFREHVAEEILFEASGVLQQDCRVADFHPVWYDITVDDGRALRISRDTGESFSLLRGSRRVLDQLGL